MTFKNTILLILSIILYSSCSHKEPTTLDLYINSQSEINQDKNNISTPLILVFYELESAEAFSKLSYWDLLKNSGEKLGADLISQTKHIITSKQLHKYQILFNERARFLGVFGKFSNIDKPTWRYVINLKRKDFNEKHISIKNYKIMKD